MYRIVCSSMPPHIIKFQFDSTTLCKICSFFLFEADGEYNFFTTCFSFSLFFHQWCQSRFKLRPDLTPWIEEGEFWTLLHTVVLSNITSPTDTLFTAITCHIYLALSPVCFSEITHKTQHRTVQCLSIWLFFIFRSSLQKPTNPFTLPIAFHHLSPLSNFTVWCNIASPYKV